MRLPDLARSCLAGAGVSIARRRGLRLLFVVALPLAIAAEAQSDDWRVPERAARRKNPLTADPECVAVGKELYDQQCAACHGPKGRGDGVAAAHLDPKPRDFTATSVMNETDGALFWKIGEGHPPMPGFKVLISEDGRWHVVCYLRTLAPPRATQPTTQPATRPTI